MKTWVKIFVGLLISSPALAWSGFTHGMIAAESLREVAHDWGLNQTITITPFQQFLQKFSKEFPAIKTREDFARWLQINPDSHFDQPSRQERKRATTTPFEILERYSRRADDGRDQVLPYDKYEQFWFGSGEKTTSQAFRHMEKPSFDFFHPLNTFGFPLGRLGQATQRAQIYFDLAVRAYRLGEPYWGWNFLGIGLHYIEDLSQPYHAAQLLPPFFIKGTEAYWRWGIKQNWGWIKTVTHVVANLHHFFEGYVDHFVSSETELGLLWKQRLRGKETLQQILSIQDLAQQVRNYSNQYAMESVQASLLLTGKNLLGPKTYHIDIEDEELPEDPIGFLSADLKKRLDGASLVSRIILANFQLEGQAIRTMVTQFLKAIQKEGKNV